MKQRISHLKQHPSYDKAMHWGKLLSITGAAQLIVQIVGFASGILIIRLLSTQEYALYTLTNTMLGAMTLLSDGGISTGVMAQGGKVWEDKEKLGSVMTTGLALRRKFALGSLMISLPILFYLLMHNGAGWLTSFLITISLIPAFFAALSDSLLEIPLKLHQNILPLQKNQVYVGIGRLLLVGSTLFIFPFAYIAILAAGIPRIYGNLNLRKISNKFVDETKLPDPLIKKEILIIVKRSLPAVVYYCLSGQITIWIISVFGNSTSVAQIGALGRLAVLLNLVSVIFGTLIVPRFARIKNQDLRLRGIYSKIIAGFFVFGFFIVVFTWFFSDYLLWILGKNYAGLKTELTLMIIGSCINLIMSIGFSLYLSRGWILKPHISISVSVMPIILGCFMFDISNLKGVLYLNSFVALIQMILHVGFGFYKILKLEKKYQTN
ncbi:polysaccharide biosynthesis protein [Flavobacterium sp. ZS1P70]|uniref:Polysaccharide biosynthesis protein n=1 Tax=Flavobacterium zhoui TaxID=3230414 RepID=A0ABW6I6T2_9FLAO